MKSHDKPLHKKLPVIHRYNDSYHHDSILKNTRNIYGVLARTASLHGKYYTKISLLKTGATTLTDQELLDQFHLDGDNKWLGILLQRYTLLLLGVCMKYLKDEEEAKDAVQQVFEKSLKELQKYKVDYFKSWIYMVAKNHCLMKLRGKGRIPVPVTEKMSSTRAEESNITDHLQKEELLNRLSAAILLLGLEQRSCIEMFYLQKKSYHEIAASTGYTLMQVKSHIQNGKRNLKMLLQKKNK